MEKCGKLKYCLKENADQKIAHCKIYKGCTLAEYSDFCAHANSKKYLRAAKPFSLSHQSKLPFEQIWNTDKLRCAKAERNIAIFSTCLSAIGSIDI